MIVYIKGELTTERYCYAFVARCIIWISACLFMAMHWLHILQSSLNFDVVDWGVRLLSNVMKYFYARIKRDILFQPK